MKTKPQFVTIDASLFENGQAVIYQADSNKFIPSDGSTLLTLAGDWSTDTFYGVDYIVTHNGSSYASKVAHTSSDGSGTSSGSDTGTGTGSSSFDDEPGVGADWETYWQLLAEGADTDSTVLLTTDQTIGGTKTFSNSPVIPTPTTGDNTTKAASTAFVKAAIDALIGGAPGALDTLNELAAALGDDADYAATITTELATKAADDSVVHLTGAETVAGVKTFSSSPVVPTPTADMEVATKKYVDDNIGAGSGTGTGTSGSSAWGGITGTLSDQTDLQAALDAKADSLGTDDNYVTDAEKVVIGNTSGTNTGDQTISDATISLTDITTNNVSITKHGFAPKAPNDATKYLDGTGAYSVPAGTGGGGSVTLNAQATMFTQVFS